MARLLVRVSLEQRSVGVMWLFTGTELLPVGQGGGDGNLKLLVKARHGLVPLQLLWKTSCTAFPVIWPSNYSDPVLFLFPSGAPSPQSSRELPRPLSQADPWWRQAHVSMPQAKVSPLLCRARGRTAAARDNREWGDRLRAGTEVRAACRGKAAKLSAINWAGPWITSLPWLNRLQDSVQMFSFVV